MQFANCTMQRALNETPDLPEAGKQSSVPGLLRFTLAWQFSGGLGSVKIYSWTLTSRFYPI